MLRRSVSAIILFLALAMCASALAAGRAGMWLDVPFVAQEKDGCGAAAIAMIMQYWERQQGQSINPEADPAQIFRALYSQPAHGIYASAMENYFLQNGYRAFAFAGDWADLERQLEKGRPLVVALKPPSGSSLHYVVVAGIDEPNHLVLVNDPAQRKLLKLDQYRFEREWNAAGHWLLLAVPR
ncbi:MAG TPA: C39 family peptidase [Terracidiphilus sp.]|jgi:uncharacterized protein YvpB|nr:C39 family peptidase [Terracidiphilus sp.]